MQGRHAVECIGIAAAAESKGTRRRRHAKDRGRPRHRTGEPPSAEGTAQHDAQAGDDDEPTAARLLTANIGALRKGGAMRRLFLFPFFFVPYSAAVAGKVR